MKKKEDPKANKKRVVKDYENLSPELLSLMHAAYPNGFDGAMISFFDRDGKRVSAIPFETDEIYYLIRWVERKAKPAKVDPDLEADLDTEGSSEGDDEIFADDEESDDSGDVSLDDIENAENSFSEDDNY
ncbi:MAG: hypothetical protein KA109_13470 [Saprospiraceae bacterium]|jgi:hypothetical protein|nr:hypothetical protein [Saprospiraceae bacterium]MBK6481440.1 hypothetical protein [Saprospiraceae bacterium]MBK6815912.1 hypothetical protein [Saprospiraceae bacterium]MBK7370616.1 hypothetical protein [Saprospiraceae bacterium]MBK7438775.1 hypothetical protein [Saprospiraceae bacterium]